MTPLRLGIDIGRSSTHVALLDGRSVLATASERTAPDDIDSGVRRTIGAVLREARVGAARVGAIGVGTAFASSALAQTPALQRVAAVRIGDSMTRAVRPFSGWPDDVARRIDGGSCIVEGGVDVMGDEAAGLDTAALRRFLRTLPSGEHGVAVTAAFSEVDPSHELRALAIVREELGHRVRVTLSHEVGGTGLVERENATILNSSLTAPMDLFAAQLGRLLVQLGLGDASLYFSCNDGSVVTLEFARHLPVATVASETASAFLGAAVLAGASDAVVLVARDGGLSVGAVLEGALPEVSLGGRVSGVPVRLRLPDAARFEADAAGFEADALGGHGELTPAVLAALHEASAYVGTGSPRTPLVLVGEASPRMDSRVPGISDVLHPRHARAAAAVGAAVAPVHGTAEAIARTGGSEQRRVEEELRARALRNAVRAGADAHRVTISEFTVSPLTYLGEPLARFSARAVGPVIPT